MGESHLNIDDQEPVATSSKKAKEPDCQSENRRWSTRSTTAHTSPLHMSDKGDSRDYSYNERLEIARKQQQMYWDAIIYENKFKEKMTDPAVIAEQEQILEDINKSKASCGRGQGRSRGKAALQDDDETPVPRKGTKKCEKESDDDADDNKSTKGERAKGKKSKAPSKCEQEDQGTVPAKPKSLKHASSEKPHDSNEDNSDDASPSGGRGRKSKAHSKHEKEDQGTSSPICGRGRGGKGKGGRGQGGGG